MKDITFRKHLGEPVIVEHAGGYQVRRGNRKDILAFCDTQEEARELVLHIELLEKGELQDAEKEVQRLMQEVSKLAHTNGVRLEWLIK